MQQINNKKIHTYGFTLYRRVSSLRTSFGFTLIEIMVSVAIFTVIITVGMGSLVTLLRNYEVTQSEKRVNDGLNYALETITREMRLGKDYYINPGGVEVGGNDGFGSSVGFNATDGRGYVRYSLVNDALQLNRTGSLGVAPNGVSNLTDTNQIIVKDLRFSVLGTDTFSNGDLNQPVVWIQIKARSARGSTDRSRTVQTLVSQRTLDF